MKIAIVVGTRPEVIKMCPVIRECQARGVNFFIIHSNQHYSAQMDAVFFQELEIPAPKYNLHVGSGTHGNQTGNIMIKIEPIFMEEKPDVMLAQGDTNTVAAAALAAHKLGIKVGHIEAGLRSYDRTMPEESNRVVTDHVSDMLFAPTLKQLGILRGEGISDSKISVVGNTIVDAVLQNKELAQTRSDILKRLGVTPKEFILVTAHRAGNVDTAPALKETLAVIGALPGTVVWPIHVRTVKSITTFGLELPKNVITCDPLGFFDFLNLEQNAKLIVTDSGGVQEEACILGVPCITIRENTERPETVDVGANVLIGRSVERLREALERPKSSWKNPFGDGTTSTQIIDKVLGVKTIDPRDKNIVVVGLGYMGLPTALLLARSGYQVVGFDIDPSKVDALNSGRCFFDEQGMPELLTAALSTNRFKASTTISPANVYIIAVPTPHIGRQCDLTYVLKAAESVATVAQDGDLVIVESTIKPRTCEDEVLPIFQKRNLNVQLVHCPERAIPGDTLREIVHNDRIVGGLTEEAAQRAERIYASFVAGKIFRANARTAEVAKLMENTFRDVNIALANEFLKISDELQFDVWEAIRLANRHPRVEIMQPGPGVGGHCIAIDPWFLTENTKNAKLIVAAREINDSMPGYVTQRLYRESGNKGQKLKVGVLGLAYKKNVDDARETPAEHIIELLQKDGHEVRAHDPLVKDWDGPREKDLAALEQWADALILVTDHDAYKSFRTTKLLVDTRNLYHR
ncbi:MAG: UDP-N-acetylglucosamine 2-epimerase (non-hydrolyzing) [Deltaproteobacteria bacterium]|nr:UDP-N-acetylglucosamine 2-epimerase (non-hydrolyzing) [Deltaproteobacteria bacterium]